MAEASKADKAAASKAVVEKWLGHIKTYDNAFAKWEKRVEKIIKRYRDDQSDTRAYKGAKFNILWSNVQTLTAATFARLPKPDVSRRFKDNDPIGRIASLILERGLGYEIEHYSDYRAMLKSSVLDRFLGGRATAWARYEPKDKDGNAMSLQVTEDVEDPQELGYECAPLDYVHWKDFGHTVARTWEEVYAVWRKVYMTREALVSRFGDEGEKVPLDAQPEDAKRGSESSGNNENLRGLVYEIWDKETKEAIWIAKSIGAELDRRPDPLGLEEFFPCPKPMYATLTNDKLEPVPDFTIYQDQAAELDLLSDRIDGLVKALKVMGVYDGSITEISRLFTEGDNNTLVPVKNWAAFAEKQGLKGAIDLVDLSNIVQALEQSYQAMEQIKNQVYELTGISDIIRGQSEASETATAQQLKGQYANLRLKTYQEGVSEFATEALQIKAQIMCNKFSPETLLMISAADQLTVTDTDVLAVAPELGQAPPVQPPVPGMPPQPPQPPPIAMMPKEAKKQIVFQAALKLLMGERAENPEAVSPNPLRSFRVEIAADSLIYLDEKNEQESRVQFIAAQGGFMRELVGLLQNAGPAAPALLPVAMEMWKFGVTGFKVGKQIEGAFDEAAEKLKQLASQPPQPDPAMIEDMQKKMVEEITAQVEQKNMQKQMAIDAKSAQDGIAHSSKVAQDDVKLSKRAADLDIREMKFNATQEAATLRAEITAQETENTHRTIDTEAVNAVKDLLRNYQDKVKDLVQSEVSKPDEKENASAAASKVEALNGEVLTQISEVLKVLSAPKRVLRDASGRATGMEPVLSGDA